MRKALRLGCDSKKTKIYFFLLERKITLTISSKILDGSDMQGISYETTVFFCF
jgi:hypothetical protein